MNSNRLKEIKMLESVTSLLKFNCTENCLKSLAPLRNNSLIVELFAGSNELSDLDFIK